MAEMKRQVAYKVRIADIQSASYVVLGGWDPNYIITNGKKISRVNIMGTIIAKEQNTLMIDDGSASISVRNFEEGKDYNPYNQGDMINVVGKVREYNSEKYIIDEAIRKTDLRWLKLRKKEIEILKRLDIGEDANQAANKNQEVKLERRSEEAIAEKTSERSNSALEENVIVEEKKTEENHPKSMTQKIIEAIRELDASDGAEIEEIIKQVGDCESTIALMIKKGDIFENRAGRVKIL